MARSAKKARVVFVARIPEPGERPRDLVGTPTRARACECVGVRLVDEAGGSCVRCGRFLACEIDASWMVAA